MSTKTDELAARMRGEVIRPGDEGYEQARRVWNGMIDLHPAVIAKCVGTADVIAALDHARRNGLPMTARGGGHGVAGKAVCDGGVVIDLSAMDDVHVDHASRTARVGAGATWSQVDRETQAFGLAVTGGADSRTGVAGLTLGGGVGWLARRHGLTIDSLHSAEVVLADGRVVTASAHDHPDLYWALRGGGGNFGIVTSFEFRLHEVGPEVGTLQAFYPMSQAAQALTSYRAYMTAASDEVTCYAMFITVPSVEPFPEAEHGETTLGLFACHAGELGDGERDLTPLTEMGDPMFSVLAPMPYVALQSTFDAGTPDGGRYYWKAAYVDDLSDELISTLVQRIHPLPGAYSSVAFEPMGGAIGKVGVSATAFAHRDARFGILVSPGWADAADDEAGMAWARSLFTTISSHGSTGVYSNYMNRDEGDRIDEAWATNRARLLEVKRTYDPEGVFHGNVDIGGHGAETR
jgi:FAD/FMN-containing dehydrogenase